jgi:hypothetical protein
VSDYVEYSAADLAERERLMQAVREAEAALHPEMNYIYSPEDLAKHSAAAHALLEFDRKMVERAKRQVEVRRAIVEEAVTIVASTRHIT